MWLCRALLPCLGDDEMHDHHRFADEMPRRPSYRPRPEEPPVLGHRFSPRPLPSSPLLKPFSPPTSPRQSVYLPFPAGPADPSAPRVLVLDPGSGETCNALQGLVHIHLAVAPEFDLQVKRYPPGWRSMVGVKLTEAEAAAASKVVISGVRSAWPSVDDLRGPAHPCNLATWASTLFDKRTNLMRSVDLTATGCDRWSARHAKASRRATSEFDCLVCGSRGGEVTLPALWLLGCRMPAVVINGGCAREKAWWLWPPGVYVVLVTGGRDRICNEYFAKQGGDILFVERLWRAVPSANKGTTAILHLPLMSHRPDAQTLHQVLPTLIAYAASGFAPKTKPTADSFGVRVPSLLVTSECPAGEWLESLNFLGPALPAEAR